ncbi:MAG: hypothetical protein L3K24_13820 [Gammaproteobacteria bacterium]|nr:hypothetical protein [Gammaproteobacteria bacterium]
MKKYLWTTIVSLLLVFSCVNAESPADSKKINFMKQQVVQALLDNSSLNSYFHAGVLPGRIPLLIVINDVFTEKVELNKFGRSVEFMEKDMVENQNRPYLNVHYLIFENNESRISYEYPAEGIRGNAVFSARPKTIQPHDLI